MDVSTTNPVSFFLSLGRYSRDRLANDILSGYAFDRDEWAEFLGSTVIDDKWLRGLRACVKAEGY